MCVLVMYSTSEEEVMVVVRLVVAEDESVALALPLLDAVAEFEFEVVSETTALDEVGVASELLVDVTDSLGA